MLWVEHTFVALIITRWLWRVGSWFAAVHAENMRCAELMLEARLNAEIINRGAAQHRENKVGCNGELQDALQSEWQRSPVEGSVDQLHAFPGNIPGNICFTATSIAQNRASTPSPSSISGI